MDENKKPVGYDLDGYEIVTKALMDLINTFPGLYDGEVIEFSVLGESSGIAVYPISSAVIESERRNIIGEVKQVIVYPFYVIYRTSGQNSSRKENVKEWLDDLGRWLEKKEVKVSGQNYKLESYPDLTGNRKITSIARQTSSYLDTENDDKTENWAIYITMNYSNEFKL